MAATELPRLYALTDPEPEVLGLASAGNTNGEIATTLQIAPETVLTVVPGSRRVGAYMLGPGSTSGGGLVYVRVVRFADVTPERVEGLLARIEESGGPPPGVPAKGLQMLFDEGQGTAVVLQLFDTAEDMRAGAEVFSAMDPAETPGTRVSVDMCELKLERHL